MKNLLLRGCVLRNTDFVIGLVVYAGNETKTMLNNGEKRRKTSTLDSLLARDLLWCIIILIVLCTTSAVVSQAGEKQWYVPVDKRDISSSSEKFVDGFFNFLAMLIIMQVLIPVSLYVTMEFVKLGQVGFLGSDEELYSAEADKGVECRTFNITDELGMVEHVFSDKTGTLTENSMVFRQLSLDGVIYDHLSQAEMIRRATAAEKKKDKASKESVKLKRLLSGGSQGPSAAASPIASPLTTRKDSASLAPTSGSKTKSKRIPRGHHRRVISDTGSIMGQLISEDLDDIDFDSLELESTVIPDHYLKSDLYSELALDQGKFEQEHPSKVVDFFLALAVCNTVVISAEQQTKIVKNVPRLKDITKARSVSKIKTITTPVKQVFKSVTTPLTHKMKRIKTRLNDVMEQSDISSIATGVVNGSYQATGDDQHSQVSTPQMTSRGFKSEVTFSSPLETAKRPLSLNLGSNASGNEKKTDSSHDVESGISTGSGLTQKEVNFDLSLLTPTTEQGPSNQDDTILKPKDVIYEAESPDEAALVYTAKGYGVTLMKRDTQSVLVQWPNQEQMKDYQVEAILPFDSHRKMMSVIISTQTRSKRRFFLLTKGADSAIFAVLRLDQRDKQLTSETHVEKFAREGLRTLAFGRRELEKEEVARIKQSILQAESSTGDATLALREIYLDVEKELEYLGITAIEDRLQDGVPEAIEALRKAGLAVWILTGDKLQTATEIAISCNLIKKQDRKVFIANATKPELAKQLEQYEPLDSSENSFFGKLCGKKRQPVRDRNRVVVVDGRNLAWIFEDSRLRKRFIGLAARSDAVVCCRVTPLQKSEVVVSMSRALGSRTLAIGDGANDVSMIQAANIGIGISGKEGRQAVLASDYSIPKFRFISKLLLVHGHWNYDRMVKLIFYFLFKNISFCMLLFYYQPLSGWSGSRQVPEFHIMLYNVVYTGAIPILTGIFEQKLPCSELAQNPHLYATSSTNQSYTLRNLFLTFIDAFYQSGVQFIMLFLCYRESTGQLANGDPDSTISLLVFGQLQTMILLISQYISYAFVLNHFTWLSALIFGVSLVGFIVIDLIYNALSNVAPYLEFWSMQSMAYQPLVYLIIPLIVVISCLPRVVYVVAGHILDKDEVQRNREQRQKQHSTKNFKHG